jgi:hypothetical protein
MKDFLDRINVWRIFTEHKDTLYDYAILKSKNRKVIPFSDKFIFFYAPLSISASLVLILNLKIDSEYLNVIITSLSIFVGLLFSLLTLVFGLVKEQKNLAIANDATIDSKNKYQLLKELFINISFSIFLSIVTILITLLTQFKSNIIGQWFKKVKFYDCVKWLYISLTNIFAIFLVLMFIMTLLMILKRFFLIFKTEVNE